MFTGLVEATGTVLEFNLKGEQASLVLEVPFASELALGDSIAVNGCCLTVATLADSSTTFDLLTQTLEVTSLGTLKVNTLVNLERAMMVGDRFGGHFVQGHIDATGILKSIEQRGQDHVIEISLPLEIHRLCLEKGSITLDGISLTIAELTSDSAIFWITPYTWAHTHLQAAAVSQMMNLEVDMFAKYVDKLLEARSNKV